MKKVILFLAAAFAATGCMSTRKLMHEPEQDFTVIDSVGTIEDINSPGTFRKVYDTLVIQHYYRNGDNFYTYMVKRK